MGTRTTTFLPQTRFFETIERYGSGTTSMGPDGITRFKFLGPVTRKESRTISVIANFTSIWDIPKPTGLNPGSPVLTKPTCHLSSQWCNLWMANFFHLVGHRESFFLADPSQACSDLRACEVDPGDEVKLIYWGSTGLNETNLIKPSNRTSRTVVTTAITFNGQDLYYRGIIRGNFTSFPSSETSYISQSVMTGDFTFVSPTVYIAHHPIRARISHWKSGGPTTTSTAFLRSSGIIPLNATDVYSYEPYIKMEMTGGFSYIQLVAEGRFTTDTNNLWNEPYSYTRRLNYSDLVDPVPATAYFNARYDDCWQEQKHCKTITDGSFRPKLAMGLEKWVSIFPKGFECSIPMLVDPPIELYQIDSATSLPSPQITKVTPAASRPTIPPTTPRPGNAGTPPFPIRTSVPSSPEAHIEPNLDGSIEPNFDETKGSYRHADYSVDGSSWVVYKLWQGLTHKSASDVSSLSGQDLHSSGEDTGRSLWKDSLGSLLGIGSWRNNGGHRPLASKGSGTYNEKPDYYGSDRRDIPTPSTNRRNPDQYKGIASSKHGLGLLWITIALLVIAF